LHALEINYRLTKFQKPKYDNKLQELPFLLTNQTSITHHVCNGNFDLSWQTSMLVVYGHEVLPHNTPRVCNFTFSPPCMFQQIIKLWHQQIFPSINLIAYFVTNHVQLVIAPHHIFAHGNFATQTSLNM
jgi:hypothetical protein